MDTGKGAVTLYWLAAVAVSASTQSRRYRTMVSPLLQSPNYFELTRAGPHPEVLIYAVIGVVAGGLFCLGYLGYYLLYKFNMEDETCYRRRVDEYSDGETTTDSVGPVMDTSIGELSFLPKEVEGGDIYIV